MMPMDRPEWCPITVWHEAIGVADTLNPKTVVHDLVTERAARAILKAREEAFEWQPIETAPWGKWILCWWTPINDNPYAETVIVAQVVSPPDLYAEGAKPLTYWDGHDEFTIERLTHWMPLPSPPAIRQHSQKGER